ncbi:hypothetical protein [Streptomyces sp. 6N106]|uniref:hypothetical protein n=1 Tax=Streptomyces sp. 6N106 TaxID=3457418 RepID=UPI003FCFC6A3
MAVVGSLRQRPAATIAARTRAKLADQPQDLLVAVLREWTATYRHATVTTEEFTALAGRRAAQPLDALFTAWLHAPRLPELPGPR